MSANAIPSDGLLAVRDLRAYFHTRAGPARAVDGISFVIQPGETFALVGESGSGKSVAALAIMQLLPQPAGHLAGGSVHFDGRLISSLPPVEMRRVRGNDIAMIFQEPMTALNPVFTVGWQIEEVLRLHQRLRGPALRRRAIEALEEVGLPEPAQRHGDYPHQLSGGMRQRVMIAMALACRPRLLIADEPTTALDVTIQAQILDLMRRLQRERGTAVLLITHDMGVVRETASRVGVMYGGKLVEQGPADQVLSQPAHPYTELLLRALPAVRRRGLRLDTIPGLVPKATEAVPGCRFANRCPAALPACRLTPPEEILLEGGRRVACHLVASSQAGRRDALPLAEASAPEAPPAGDYALCIRDLRMHFPIRRGFLQRAVGHVRAVDGVTLDLRRGETLALVGESGCGKTTIGKCVIRLLHPSGGSIRFGGREVSNAARRELKPLRKRVQFVFQDPFSSLNPRQTVGDILLEAMRTHGIGADGAARRARAAQLLVRVGLDADALERYPHEFSGGQRQRIAIARALAPEPDLLICDEATSALDVSVQAQILNLLKDLQSELGLSYLFITHNLGVVEYLADRVAVMYLGRIVEEGTTAEVFGTPRHPYTRALFSAVPQVAEDTGIQRIVLGGDVPSPANPPPGCPFHPRCPIAGPECAAAYPDPVAFSPSHQARCLRVHAQDASVPG